MIERVLIVLDVAIAKGLDGAGVMTNDSNELIDVLLGDMHGFFEHNPLDALSARWGG